MQKLMQDIYEMQKAEIHNKDVPKLFHSMLRKQDKVIFERDEELNDVLSQKINLFRLFFRQYNTILVLTNKVSHIHNSEAIYLDVTSVNILIRSCHERFLTFWYLTHPSGFEGVSQNEELWFKWLCYRHGGLVDKQRTQKLCAPLVDTSNLRDLMAGREEERRELFLQIKSHALFSNLEKNIQNAIEHYGEWRIGNQKRLSWNAMARLSPIKNAVSQLEYHQLSLYAHTGYAGLELDRNHDGNIDGLLAYLYVLAASYISTLDSILPGSDVEFTSRELACVQEFLEIAAKWITVPPLSALGE